MNPEKLGKTLGVGLRVAGRMAQQRVQDSSQATSPSSSSSPNSRPSSTQPVTSRPGIGTSSGPQFTAAARASIPKAHNLTRAAGRGMGGFLRPFGRLGGILWLEVTGFFFGLFALYFAQVVWKTRLSYAVGKDHQLFLFGVGLTLLFGYLSISAFWRAKRK